MGAASTDDRFSITSVCRKKVKADTAKGLKTSSQVIMI
jgi:hypothetical protein